MILFTLRKNPSLQYNRKIRLSIRSASKVPDKFIKVFLVFIAALIISQKGYAQNTLSLNGKWKFALAKTEGEKKALQNFHTLSYNPKAFKTINVPSNWAVLGFEEPVYRGFEDDIASEGIYIHNFDVPENWDKKRVILHFGGVWSSAQVWLNGQYLGEHFGGFSSFSFDISDKIKSEEKNILAVRVKQVNRDYKFDTYDDWTLGGIYRDVELEVMPEKRWLESLRVETDFDESYQDADLIVKALVSDNNTFKLPGNYPFPGSDYQLQFTLTDANEKVVAQRKLNISSHSSTDREVKVEFHVEYPKAWNAEHPYLYDLTVELIEDYEVLHIKRQRVGFREISTDGGVFRINGQAVKLWGVNRHDEHSDVGRATTEKHWREDLMLMKEANINYVLAAHYAHARGFINLCDELGMYVGEEVSIGGAGDDQMRDQSYISSALIRTYETITRDINNPSIIYWSIGNEDPLTNMHLTAARVAKGLDPTRPLLLPWRYESWMPEEFDILSVHYWQPKEYDSIAAISKRPIITTEYTHSYGYDRFGGLEARWKALTQHPAGAGGAVWVWADQGIKTPTKRSEEKYGAIVKDDAYLRIDASGWDGVVDSYRNKTRDFWEIKSVYAQVYPAVDQVQVIPEQEFVAIPVKNDFDFTNLDNISVKWMVFEDDKVLDSGESTLSGQPHSTSVFKLPTTSIVQTVEGKSYYAKLRFTDSLREITTRSVALIPKAFSKPKQSDAYKLELSTGQDSTIIICNHIKYVFNSNTGQLQSAYRQDQKMLAGLYPKIWKDLQGGDVSVIGKENLKNVEDLRIFTPHIKGWEVQEPAEQITIQAKVNYLVSDSNSFQVAYTYSVNAGGELNVYYEITPKVSVPNLPVAGVTLVFPAISKNIKWLGLGPYDAYPNKKSAPQLGVWSFENIGDAAYGTKATNWIEKTTDSGIIHIDHSGYMEMDENNLEEINLYTEVLSKPEKGRCPDDTFPLLKTKSGNPFIGSFSFSIK